jgi:hypothetical protein
MTHKRTAMAAMLLMLMPAAPAFPQAEVNPDHFADPPEAQVSMAAPDLGGAAEAYSAELQAQENVVEETRQAAISAGIQGDGAGSYISEYQNQMSQLTELRAKLKSSDKMLATAR